MGRHRKFNDETALLPATIEEMAARERADDGGSRRRPLIVGLLTAALLATGATAWALSRPSDNNPTVLPSQSANSFNDQFNDGFGEGTPSPSPSVPPSPTANPSASPLARASGATPTPTPSVKSSSVAGQAGLVFSYRVHDWNGRWQIEAVIKNLGPDPIDWTIVMTLPNQSSMTKDWGATFAGDKVLTITRPPWLTGPLKPGQQVDFGFSGDKPPTKDPNPISCTVNGTNCDALKP